MSTDIVLLMIVLGLLVLFTAKAVNRAERRPAEQEEPPADIDGSPAANASWKINRTIQILQENLPADKLTRGKPVYVDFYLAYLLAFAETVCEAEEVPFEPAMESSIHLEVIRLGGPGQPIAAGSGALLADILATAPGRRGYDAGRMDAIEACDPRGKGPYFKRIRGYFQSEPASRET